jgi:hypothetical protein
MQTLRGMASRNERVALSPRQVDWLRLLVARADEIERERERMAQPVEFTGNVVRLATPNASCANDTKGCHMRLVILALALLAFPVTATAGVPNMTCKAKGSGVTGMQQTARCISDTTAETSTSTTTSRRSSWGVTYRAIWCSYWTTTIAMAMS